MGKQYQTGDVINFKSGGKKIKATVLSYEDFFDEYILQMPDGTKRQVVAALVKSWNSGNG